MNHRKIKKICGFITILFFIMLQSVAAGGKQESNEAEQHKRNVENEIQPIEEDTQPVVPASEEGATGDDAEGSAMQPLAPGDTVFVTVDKAVDIAKANNLNIQSEKISLKVKKRNKNTVFNYFYPTISASGTLSRMHEDPGTVETLVPVPNEDLEEYGYYDYVIPTNELPLDNTYGVLMEVPPGSGNWVAVDPSTVDEFGMYDYVIPSNELPEDMYGAVMKVEEDIPHTWNVGGQLNMNLALNAQLFFGIKATVLDYDAGRLSLQTAKKKLERDVQKQFYNLLLMQENIALLKENIATAKERYEQAAINYENGLVSEYAKLSARVAWENMKPSLESTRVGYQSALLGFKQQLGIPLEVELELEGAIEPEPITLDAESLSRQYLAERLDIQSLIKQIEIVKNSRDATIAGMTPSVALTLSFDPSFQKDPFEDAWFEDVEDDWKQRSGMFGVTVSVPLDKLLPFSKTWVELANTKDNIKKMRLNLTQAMRGAEMEVKTIVMNLKKSLESIESLEMNVELAKRAYNMAEEAYNAGNRELLEVQQAEDELKKARLEVLREQYNYTTGLLDLEYALNTSLEEIKEKYHE